MATEPEAARDATRAGVRTFDGIVCFGGGDWWYHNRGHYDMQLMQRFKARVPVLWVNSLGMRLPRISEGSIFLRRVIRKLGSFRRGYAALEPAFAVFTPVAVPGRAGMLVSRMFLGLQVRRAARRLGITQPLAWVTCPPAVEALSGLRPVGLVYQRTDRSEAYPEGDTDLILQYHLRLQHAADLTLYCSRVLFESEAGGSPRAAFIDHGVDYPIFAAAGDAADDPEDVASIPHPRVGFVGGIDALTFDPPLFLEIARRLPDVSFVLVGACSLPGGWVNLPNVRLLGQRPYEDVARYMAACDVLIMPWNKSEWIRACNPVKLKEYLAVGRPVVSTPFPELAAYPGCVREAATAEMFASAIRESLAKPADVERMRSRVREETWDAKAEAVLSALAHRGLKPAAARGTPA